MNLYLLYHILLLLPVLLYNMMLLLYEIFLDLLYPIFEVLFFYFLLLYFLIWNLLLLNSLNLEKNYSQYNEELYLIFLLHYHRGEVLWIRNHYNVIYFFFYYKDCSYYSSSIIFCFYNTCLLNFLILKNIDWIKYFLLYNMIKYIF